MRRFLAALWRLITAPFRPVVWLLGLIFRWVADIFRDFWALFKNDENLEDSPAIDALGKALENPVSVLDHLNALRKHLFRSTVALLISSSLSFAFAEEVLAFLALPIDGIERLQAIGVTESIGVFMRVSLLSGFALALPYIVFELLLFAAPGLTRRERFIGLMALPLVALLFVAGMAFAYFIVLRPALTFLLNFIFETTPQPASYYPFVTGLMFWFGLSFEFPLVIYVIVSLGLIRAEVLVKGARAAIVILAVLAAAITPTVDPINMLLVWGPLVALYFIGVGLAFIAQRARDRRARK